MANENPIDLETHVPVPGATEPPTSMANFGFPYVLKPEKGHSPGLSTAHAQLWKTATDLVSSIPHTWTIRCHELARALHTVLVSPLALHLQDGELGSQDHSWLWVGERPEYVKCQVAAQGLCDREAVFAEVTETTDSFGYNVRMNYCAQHTDESAEKYPIIRQGSVILDPYFPGALPPVVMSHVHSGLALSQGLYRPGPLRTDIDESWLSKLERHFKEHLNPIAAL